MTIKTSVKTSGTLTVPSPFPMQGEFSVSEKLHALASRHQWVERHPKRIKAASYTIRMAQNDFKNFAS